MTSNAIESSVKPVQRDKATPGCGRFDEDEIAVIGHTYASACPVRQSGCDAMSSVLLA